MLAHHQCRPQQGQYRGEAGDSGIGGEDTGGSAGTAGSGFEYWWQVCGAGSSTVRLDEPFALGLLLLGLAAGAPFMPKIVGIAKGDLALSVGLMVLLMVGTTIFLPVALPLLVKGVQVNPWKIARFLVLLLLLPLIVGLFVKARAASLAARLRHSSNGSRASLCS